MFPCVFFRAVSGTSSKKFSGYLFLNKKKSRLSLYQDNQLPLKLFLISLLSSALDVIFNPTAVCPILPKRLQCNFLKGTSLRYLTNAQKSSDIRPLFFHSNFIKLPVNFSDSPALTNKASTKCVITSKV
jgi:hypothetical protein